VQNLGVCHRAVLAGNASLHVPFAGRFLFLTFALLCPPAPSCALLCPPVPSCCPLCPPVSRGQELERLSRFSSSVATARLISSPSGTHDASLAGALEGLKVRPNPGQALDWIKAWSCMALSWAYGLGCRVQGVKEVGYPGRGRV